MSDYDIRHNSEFENGRILKQIQPFSNRAQCQKACNDESSCSGFKWVQALKHNLCILMTGGQLRFSPSSEFTNGVVGSKQIVVEVEGAPIQPFLALPSTGIPESAVRFEVKEKSAISFGTLIDGRFQPTFEACQGWCLDDQGCMAFMFNDVSKSPHCSIYGGNPLAVVGNYKTGIKMIDLSA